MTKTPFNEASSEESSPSSTPSPSDPSPSASQAATKTSFEQLPDASASVEEIAEEAPSEAPEEAPSEAPEEASEGKPKKVPATVSTADKVKFAGLIFFFALIAAISIFVVHFITSMGEGTIEVQLEHAIQKAGTFGVLICLGLQFVQVVVAFIPGEVVQIAIGYVYGTVWGGLITLVGALVSSVFVFYLVRKLGMPFVQSMIGGKDNRLLRFFEDERKRNATVFVLYLIPGLPKDVFNYLVPLTKMRPSEFFVLSTIARAPAIFASTFVAEAFKQGNYVAMIIVAVVFGGLGIIGVIFNQKIMAGVDRLLDKVSPRRRMASGGKASGEKANGEKASGEKASGEKANEGKANEGKARREKADRPSADAATGEGTDGAGEEES